MLNENDFVDHICMLVNRVSALQVEKSERRLDESTKIISGEIDFLIDEHNELLALVKKQKKMIRKLKKANE